MFEESPGPDNNSRFYPSPSGRNRQDSFTCHSRESGNPGKCEARCVFPLDSRLRGNDDWGEDGNDDWRMGQGIVLARIPHAEQAAQVPLAPVESQGLGGDGELVR